MSEPTTIRTALDDGILTVTIDRPHRLNAFTLVMADELETVFREVNERDEVRAVVVTGSGDAFCAGMDLTGGGNVLGLDQSLTPGLADMEDLDDPGIRRVRDAGGRMALAIHACRKPVIAAINGPAVGIGATMTLAMDARLASTNARIGFVFGRLGLVPEAASTWFLPRIVGVPAALDLVLSADILDAKAAREIGLVRSVHAPEDLLVEARALADRWTNGRSAVATALSRQMLYRNSATPEQAHRIESLGLFYLSIGDGAEGINAFGEKRAPAFADSAAEMPPFYDAWVAPA
ncbi:MAG TPA: crotonase/enoyl-CoA hydratase family protein [Nocardioides sp.]|nr:crotonase/enoyl-CoA hydratase family protein [Nocardioides sp.]